MIVFYFCFKEAFMRRRSLFTSLEQGYVRTKSSLFCTLHVIIQHIDTLPKYGKKNSRCT